MAITKAQALTANEFHYVAHPSATKCFKWRRNGQTQTWVRQPDRYRVPIKYGLYNYDQLTDQNQTRDNVFVPDECPVCHPVAQPVNA